MSLEFCKQVPEKYSNSVTLTNLKICGVNLSEIQESCFKSSCPQMCQLQYDENLIGEAISKANVAPLLAKQNLVSHNDLVAYSSENKLCAYYCARALLYQCDICFVESSSLLNMR